MGIASRRTGWLTPKFHTAFRSILEINPERYAVAVPAYCLMPDHIHVLSAGMNPASDQTLWSRAVRRRLNAELHPFSLQKQAYDHVLRTNESGADAFTALAHYISENPVRAGLVSTPSEWPFTGSLVRALPGLDPRQPTFRDAWWNYWNALPD
ncbi:hypothetical protein ESB00_18420 [Oleiharenicola lentus]|jgi:REP element-mobilizing transposase RayT|uniref:Transposase IS200-like domain-containing protein n=1 Tax=Oleiharenicola lentus TaxID=2508720 RepID=A0A4Q1C5Q0_9BACT|nr:hypothetical protein [Oleiharenicola lentus]RXK53663.1 hypothetical protein ESB00_18420 [Oleiharenicola lentus]